MLQRQSSVSPLPVPKRRTYKVFYSAVTLAVFGCISAQASGQIPSSYAGSVEGRITCNDGGFPARNAHVSLVPVTSLLNPNGSSKSPKTGANARTDFDGNFTMAQVPPGEYFVSVHQIGYIDEVGLFQQALPRLLPQARKDLLETLPQVLVSSGRAHKDIILRRGGAISGRVVFADGGALDGARLRVTMVSGNLVGASGYGTDSEPFAIQMAPAVITDDRGFYRVAGLPRGKYKVSVQDRLQVFASDTPKESEARLFSVDAGDEISDGDITIPIQLFHSISGIVMRGGSPIANASVNIKRQGDTATYAGGVTNSDGVYTFPMRLSGTYVLEARYPAVSPRIERRINVQVGDSDVLDANIDLLSNPPSD